MSKIPKGEWGDYGLDPNSEEYNPSTDELKKDDELIKSAKEEIYEIRSRIGEKNKDPYTWKDDDYSTRNPDDFWHSLFYLHEDVISQIKDPEERKKIEEEATEVNQEIYRQYIPYIDAQINIFGKINSPLEKYKPHFARSAEDMEYLFQNARSALDMQNISEDEKLEYLAQIDQLQNKFDRYQKEPTLPTFENMEKDLFQKIDREYINDISRLGSKNHGSLAEDEISWQKTLASFDKLIYQAHQLKEIAIRMLNEEIRKSCTKRAESLLWQAELLKQKFEMPKELNELEARIKDLLNKASLKEELSDEIIQEISARLTEFETLKIGTDHTEQVKQLKEVFNKAIKLSQGEEVFEEDEQVEIGKENMYWAWERMGLEKNISEKDIKKAFRKLVKQYHPDINKSEDAKEKMQKINEAYEFLARLKGFK